MERRTGLLALAMIAACGGQKSVQEVEPSRHDRGTVSGTVFYLERMALPPNAEVVVQLLDASRADAPAEVVAQDSIRDGKQVPISFKLDYDASRIIPTHTYVVRATIKADGSLLFTSSTAYPVVTNGQPSFVEVRVTRVSAGTPQ